MKELKVGERVTITLKLLKNYLVMVVSLEHLSASVMEMER